MRVLLFAGLAEAVGRRELVLEDGPEGLTVGQMEARLRRAWPGLAGLPFRVAVNRAYVGPDTALAAADEVALIPPVSGG